MNKERDKYIMWRSICLGLVGSALVTSVMYVNKIQKMKAYQEEIMELQEQSDMVIGAIRAKVAKLQDANEDYKNKVRELEGQIKQLAESGYWYMCSGIATAYSPHDNQSGQEAEGDPSITSTGMRSGHGIIAVDPAKIPYGSEILVLYPDGTTYRGVAGDTGGALRDNAVVQVDIYKDTFQEAVDHGKQQVTILWRLQ